MSAKDNTQSSGHDKQAKKKRKVKGVDQKKPLLSDRQRKILLILTIAMLTLVPLVDNFRCKAACLKRIKTPYPEIACGYECPWPWAKSSNPGKR